jgi:hypothetical protein
MAFKIGEYNLAVDTVYDTNYISSNKFFIHEEYDDTDIINDLCMVYFEREIEFNSMVGPACLPQPDTAPIPGTGKGFDFIFMNK